MNTYPATVTVALLPTNTTLTGGRQSFCTMIGPLIVTSSFAGDEVVANVMRVELLNASVEALAPSMNEVVARS